MWPQMQVSVPSRRRVALVVAHQSGTQSLLELATEMNWIDDGVHSRCSVLRRERAPVSLSLMPSSTITPDWEEVEKIETDDASTRDPFVVEMQSRQPTQRAALLLFCSPQQRSP